MKFSTKWPFFKKNIRFFDFLDRFLSKKNYRIYVFILNFARINIDNIFFGKIFLLRERCKIWTFWPFTSNTKITDPAEHYFDAFFLNLILFSNLNQYFLNFVTTSDENIIVQKFFTS